MGVLYLSLAALAVFSGQDAQEAPEKEYTTGASPWQAQIFSNFTNWTEDELAQRDAWDLAHRCGGTLIADGWVLTAAHCIDQAKVDKGYRVRLGADYLDNDEGVTFRIDRMVRHADWNKTAHTYDIALVHYVADKGTKVSNAGPISPLTLYDGPPLEPGVEVYATGWGQLEEGKDKGFSSELTSVELTTVDCADYPQYEGKVAEYQLCAGPRQVDDIADTCTGDSGGPLALDTDEPVLVGVVNWGIGCFRENSAGIYLRIDNEHFRDWIERAKTLDPSINVLR